MARSGRLLAHCLLALIAAATVAGCASQAPLGDAAARPEPGAVPARTEADFAGLRRCMDNLMLDYGTRDISVVVDDLADPSQRVDAGTREMLIAAVSGMTQRSRAIRLVAAGTQPSSTPVASSQAGATAPSLGTQYALRGSLHTQGGAAYTVFGLDLSLLATPDMSVVPGTASTNAATLIAPAAGREGRVEMRKFGVDLGLPVGRDPGRDGRAVATGALLQVSAMELFGRVARLPYWSCFGATAADPSVAAEIQDWYDTMAARPAELIAYFQQQLHTRGLYEGAIDGAVNPSLKQAVASYREALGLSREPKLSLDFFKAYLAADHREVHARLHAGAATAAASKTAGGTTATTTLAAAAPIARPAPLAVRLSAASGAQRFARGEAIQLAVRPSRDAFVYCFHEDADHKIIRFFPNRFHRESRVEAAAGLQLPGAMRFEIVMNPRGMAETVSCFATDSDVMARLPAGIDTGDFVPMAVASLDQLRSAFAKASGGAVAQESFQLRPR